MSQKISALEDHTGYWLRMVSNHVSNSFASKLTSEDVSVAEWVLLRLLYKQEYLLPSHIAKQMGMTKGAITKLIDRLIDKSLVTRSASTNDGRKQTIKLTLKGARLVPKLAALADQNEKECFGHLSAKDYKNFHNLMKEFAVKLSLALIPTE